MEATLNCSHFFSVHKVFAHTLLHLAKMKHILETDTYFLNTKSPWLREHHKSNSLHYKENIYLKHRFVP